MSIANVKVVKRFGRNELWRYMGQLYFAHIFSDGVVQVYLTDKNGAQIGQPLFGHNTEDREGAMRKLYDLTH